MPSRTASGNDKKEERGWAFLILYRYTRERKISDPYGLVPRKISKNTDEERGESRKIQDMKFEFKTRGSNLCSQRLLYMKKGKQEKPP